MNYGYLVPRTDGLAVLLPDRMLGVAHAYHEHDREERLTFFSPRELTESEREQLDGQIYNFLHDVQYRITTRRHLAQIRFNPATLRILGRYYYILQIFGMGGLLLCLWSGRYRIDDIAQFFYWVLAMPACIALGAGLLAWHTRETIAGLGRLYGAPLGTRVVVHPALTKLDEIVREDGYIEALRNVRDLGMPELVAFYQRASQFGRWEAKAPNVAGVIR